MPDHLLALPEGFEIQEYRLVRLLGAGGFGITYLAFDNNLKKPVAIKEYLPNELAVRQGQTTVMPKSQQDKETFTWGLERFLDEARTLAKFKHPNIVQVYRYFQGHGTGYIVMEYAEGDTLARFIKRSGPLSEVALKKILLPILDGLAEVHGTRFLHRDIKPGNIIIRTDGSPVLLDFGAARQAVGATSRSVTAIVTPGYAPIEQYSTKGNQGPWTDIYALGAVAYTCIAGNPPPDAADRILQDTLQPLSGRSLPGYSQPFLRAIDSALSVREKDRPANIDQWRSKLTAPAPADEQTLLATRTVTPDVADLSLRHEPSDRLRKTQSEKPGRSWMYATLALMLLGGGGAGAYWWTQLRGVAAPPAASATTPAPAPAPEAPVTPADPRQQAIVLEGEVQDLLQGIDGSVPAIQRELGKVQGQREQFDERVRASSSDLERNALRADLARVSEREQHLEEELRLVQRWVRRDDELARLKVNQASAKTSMSALDYAGAVTVLAEARSRLAVMEQTRNQIGDALDARSRLRQRRNDIDALLGNEALGSLNDDTATATAEANGVKAIERGDFGAAPPLFLQADEQLRTSARERIDRFIDDLKATAESAIDRRDAVTARSAVDRAKHLLDLRNSLR